jgi:hypothetical protein
LSLSTGLLNLGGTGPVATIRPLRLPKLWVENEADLGHDPSVPLSSDDVERVVGRRLQIFSRSHG